MNSQKGGSYISCVPQHTSSHQQILTTCVMTSIDRVYNTETPWEHTDGVVFKTDDKLVTDGRSSQYTSINSKRMTALCSTRERFHLLKFHEVSASGGSTPDILRG